MRKVRLSLIITVFNEQNTISRFIESVFGQSKLPDEFIIVDGGSTDETESVISNFKSQVSNKQIKFKFIIKKGNRSVGRNEAIRNAKGEIILCSDAGCILDKNWVKNIIKPFEDKKVDVVAGYYKGISSNVFQKSLIPYVLVMEGRIDKSEFLPAARSIALKKTIWKNIGGFDEKFSHNEDYIFANKLKASYAKIVFEKRAITYWIPRKTIKEAFVMFFRFAFGDSESGIIRNKVMLIFARYIFYLYFIVLFLLIKSPYILYLIMFASFTYILWAIKKNYKYVDDIRAFVILPILQILSDVAVLTGTSLGFLKSLIKINYTAVLKNNYPFLILLVIYSATMISVISSGLPNENHPFNYQMDEWHQAQSVRNVLKYGSPNLEGSANGTMFHFFITGILLIPFYITGIINPFAIKSSVDSLLDQEKLFIVLRLTTLFFGALTLVILPKICKVLHLNTFIIVLLFTFTPVWLVLSNFFKYDIALTFWIVLSFYYFIKYGFSPNLKNFILGCFFSGVAFGVKVSGLPLLLIILLAFFIFAPSFSKKYSHLFLGILIFFFNSIFLGLPDIIFGGRNMYVYLYENIIGSSQILGNYNLVDTLLNLTLFHKFPAIFGHGLYIFSILSLFYLFILIFLDFKNKRYHDFKIKLFILLSFFVFCLSLVPLGITISANRSVVLLSFIVIINAIAIKSLSNFLANKRVLKSVCVIFFIVVLSIQIFESYLWVQIKILPSPQELSSNWIVENIKRNSDIGLENIPIYQFEPDIILKEFYNKQYDSNSNTQYNYFILNKNTKKFPEYIVISNEDFERKFLRTSLKNDLIEKIKKEKYAKIAHFPLSLPLYKYFDSYFYYPYLGLFAYPDGISIYKKM